MGQVKDRKDPRHHCGAGTIKEAFRRNLPSLGIALVLASSALAQNPKLITKSHFDAGRSWSYLVQQVEFGPRVPGSEAHLKCRDWIAEQMKKTCDNVRLQPLSHTWSQTGKEVKMWNIIGEQNWKEATTRVVLIAHWDSRPFADQDPDPSNHSTPIPGANDGASGVAVLLELAQTIKDRHPGVGIMYLMDDGEDLGPGINEMFLGATYFAENLPSPKPDYGILLDMIGDADLSVPMERNSYFKAEKLTKAFYANAYKAGLQNTFPETLGDDISDDHLTFIEHGVPTMDLIDFTYMPWHTLQDTPKYCAPSSLKKVGFALETFLTKAPAFKIGN